MDNFLSDSFKGLNSTESVVDSFEGDEAVFDFDKIICISLSFAQEYLIFKKRSSKLIKEINLSYENRLALNFVARQEGFDMLNH